jgi:hypothetical protein
MYASTTVALDDWQGGEVSGPLQRGAFSYDDAVHIIDGGYPGIGL